MKTAKKLHTISTVLAENRSATLKWLQILFCLHAVSLAVSLAKYLPSSFDLTDWLGRLLTVGVIVCLFALTAVNRRYCIAGCMRAIILLQNVCFALLPAPILVSLYQSPSSLMIIRVVYGVVLVLSWIATWFEYSAHAELAAVGNKNLAKQWYLLFAGNLLVAVLGTAMSYGAAYLSWELLSANTVNFIIGIVSKVVDVLYLWFLYKLIGNIRTKNTQSE